MSRLAIIKGETNDELRRNKERARQTMKQLKNTKNIDSSSPERTIKAHSQTLMSMGGGLTEDSPINLLLFSGMKKSAIHGLMTSSLGNTISSNNSYMNVILPLKNIIKTS